MTTRFGTCHIGSKSAARCMIAIASVVREDMEVGHSGPQVVNQEVVISKVHECGYGWVVGYPYEVGG